jgi:hypothetical protein
MIGLAGAAVPFAIVPNRAAKGIVVTVESIRLNNSGEIASTIRHATI